MVQKKCPIVFQDHPTNFKVTQAEKLTILTRFECFQTVTLVWSSMIKMSPVVLNIDCIVINYKNDCSGIGYSLYGHR